MNDPHAHDASHAAAGPPPFTPAEVEGLWADDRAATTAVVSLIVGVFAIGLILYLGVCYWVS